MAGFVLSISDEAPKRLKASVGGEGDDINFEAAGPPIDFAAGIQPSSNGSTRCPTSPGQKTTPRTFTVDEPPRSPYNPSEGVNVSRPKSPKIRKKTMSRRKTAILAIPRPSRGKTRKAQKAPKAQQKQPAQRIRRGFHEDEPVHGVKRPMHELVVTKEMVNIPPSEIGRVEVDDVWINNEFQRELLANGIDDLVKNYQGATLRQACEMFVRGCGFTLSTRRADGRISKIDGQRRLALAKWIKDTYGAKAFFIHTEIVETEGDEDEARLFNARNHRKSLTDCQKFKGDFRGGDPTAVAIDCILVAHGMSIKGVRKKGKFMPVNCVSAVKEAYRFDGTGKILDSTLNVISSAWLGSNLLKVRRQAVRATAFRALSTFLAKSKSVSLPTLAGKLSMYSMRAIEAQIPANKANSGRTRYDEMAKEIETIYNSPMKRKSQIIL